MLKQVQHDTGGIMTFQAFILINVATGCLDKVLGEMERLPDVKHAYPTTGPFDIIGEIGVPNMTELKKLVTTTIHNIEGVEKTTTCVVSE